MVETKWSFPTSGRERPGFLNIYGGDVMSVVNMVRNIKDLFPDYIVLVEIGTFFESYNKVQEKSKIVPFFLVCVSILVITQIVVFSIIAINNI